MNKKLKIIFISHYFWPEDVGTTVQSTELCESLSDLGYDVTVLTNFPHYPVGCLFPGYNIKWFSKEKYKNILIHRSYVYITSSKALWKRIFNYGSFAVSALFSGLRVKGKVDLIYVDMPPLPNGLTGVLLSKILRTKLALTIHDIEPERAVKIGLFKNKTLIRMLEWLEKKIYANADRISVVGQGLKNNLLTKGVPDEKVEVIPTWTDSNKIKPAEKFNEFRKRFANEDQFVVLYSGNIGYTSVIEPLLLAAQKLVGDKKYVFIIVGDGVKKEKLVKMAEKLNLTNVRFLPFQPFEKLNEVLASSDLCAVTLDKALSAYSVPGKAFTTMSSGRPIISLVGHDNDLMHIIDAAQSGVCVAQDNIQEIVSAIKGLSSDKKKLEEMGNNGRTYLLQHLSRDVCVKKHEEFLRRAIN